MDEESIEVRTNCHH